MKNDNIAAISTALSAAGVAVIRISGDDPLKIAEKMFKPVSKTPARAFEPNKMYAGEIVADGFSDFGMCVYFKAPKSFTGEDTVEFHSHGGVAIAQGILRKILSLGVRLAQNGEFTKRAFLNGKLSLASAEGLIDMINSSSIGGVKAGYSLYRERLTAKVCAMQEKLTAALSQIDADMDFPEEGLEETSREQTAETLKEVISEIQALLSSFKSGARVMSGVKVAICGKPNVGKSSLLNALLSYDKAIVSETAGTTRDVVEGSIDVDGVRFNLFDTAGIRDAESDIENMGVRLSEKTVKASDLVVFVLSALGADETDEKVYALIKDLPHITVINKTDCGDYKDDRADLYISAKTGRNLDALRKEIYDRTIGKVDLNGDFLCEERHYAALKNAADKLSAALDAVFNTPLDILSVDVLAGWQYLGEISGKTASEDIIDDIFSRFCVGK